MASRISLIMLDDDALHKHKPWKDQDEEYLEKMQGILSGYPHLGVPPYPSEILGYLYLGTAANADNIPMLKSMRITHVLNCSGVRRLLVSKINPYPPEAGIKGYFEFEAEDDPYYDIASHFASAFAFIDRVRGEGGRCLVHCPGVSRSGAITIGYLIKQGIPLLQATNRVKQVRRTALCNSSFMKQLVTYARHRCSLDPDITAYTTHKYGSAMDRRRINSSHLPLFV